MIVGTSKISTKDLIKYATSVESFKEYCVSLIPEEYRHLQVIVNNQVYICCLCLRKCEAVSWDVKKQILDKCLQDIRIVGCTNALIDFTDVLMYIGR